MGLLHHGVWDVAMHGVLTRLPPRFGAEAGGHCTSRCDNNIGHSTPSAGGVAASECAEPLRKNRTAQTSPLSAQLVVDLKESLISYSSRAHLAESQNTCYFCKF